MGMRNLLQARPGDLVHVPGVHVDHHQLVALGAEDDLLVGQPLGAEHLGGTGHWGERSLEQLEPR